MDIQQSFKDAVNALPAYLRERVDATKSWMAGGAWTLCDSGGNEVKPPIQKSLEGQKQTFLRLKRLDTPSTGRWLSGIATTPTVDRHGDRVDPQGAQFSLPVVVLAYHDHRRPIGSVEHVSVTAQGIHTKIRLSEASADADEIWGLLQDGVPLALSIGFQALDAEPTATGFHFKRWEWLELSIVAVPANAEARLAIGKGLVVEAGAQEPSADTEWIVKFLREQGIDPFSPASRAELLTQVAETHALQRRIERLEGAR